jgi:hypothetical protein
MPKVDLIAHRQEDQTLRDHAHACGIYWAALLESGIPFHLAECLIKEFSSDALSAAGLDEED